MTRHIDNNADQEVLTLLSSYFPEARLNNEALTVEQISTGTILFKTEQILSYLQTAFFEEHLVELQLDQSTRTFFTNIIDDNKGDEEDSEDDEYVSIVDYETGSYLKEADYLLVSPLTPAIGNAHIRTSKQVIVRFFLGTTAVELGCTFRDMYKVGDIPVLRLDFPEIGWLNMNYRRFRVKIVSGVDAKLRVLSSESGKNPKKVYQVDDISSMGLAFQIPDKKHEFEVGEGIRFNVQVPDMSEVELKATVRHITTIRDTMGYKNICGVQFDLVSRALAAEVERLAASIQRLQIRELAERTAGMRGVRLIK